jgi:hypothetical protein
MSTFVRTVDLLGPALTAVWRATRGITLIIASLAVTAAACAPVAATSPLPVPGPAEDVAETDPPPEATEEPTRDCYPGMPPAACATGGDGGDAVPGAQPPKSGSDDGSTRVVPAPDCERARPMIPC